MTTARIAAHPSRRTASSWAGRASDLRREQVRARGPEPVSHGATGPVDSSGRSSSPTAVLGTVEELWQSLVAVLETLDAQATALLCTADGLPVVGYGYCRPDVVPAARLTRTMFETRAHELTPDAEVVETVALTSGPTRTVIAAIPGGATQHLLSITADDVSMSVLQAWTHQAAVELRGLLAGQA